MEEEERTKISNVKEEERKKATNEIELFKKSQTESKESSHLQEKVAERKKVIEKNEEKDIFKIEEFNNEINKQISLPKSICLLLF